MTKTRMQIRCTCPRGQYSTACRIAHHRNIAYEIGCIFAGTGKAGGGTNGNNSGTGRKRRARGVDKRYRRKDWKARAEFFVANLFDSGKLRRGILIFLIGMFLIMLGSQVYMRVVDDQSLAQIIGSQTQTSTRGALK